MENAVSARLTASEGRKFAFTVGSAFLVFAAIAWWRGSPTTMKVLGALGGVLYLLAVTVPAKLGPLERAWMGVAHLISRVTTPIFMGVVFFIVITPIALIVRMLGKSPMAVSRSSASYWHRREFGKTRGDLTRQF